MNGVRVLEAGPRALLVELPCGEDAEAFHAELLRRRAAGELPVREIVPGARTVLLDGVEDRALAGRLRSWTVPPLDRGEGEAVEIPVVYDGPDLADVAEAWGVAVDEVPRLHARTEFRVAFCGFAPGFGYLTGLPGHAEMRPAGTALVLHGGQRAGPDHLDARAHPRTSAGTKRTRVPGPSRAAGSRPGSHSATGPGIRPMSCQPPGDVRG